MNDSVALSKGVGPNSVSEYWPMLWRTVLVSGFVLALGLTLCAWMYHQGVQSLSIRSLPVRAGDAQSSLGDGPGIYLHFDRWVFGMLAATLVGGLGSLLALLRGLRRWQSESMRRLAAKDKD